MLASRFEVHRFVDDHFVRVAGSTRINVKISEQSGRVTDLNLPGLTVHQAEVAALEAQFSATGLGPQVSDLLLEGQRRGWIA